MNAFEYRGKSLYAEKVPLARIAKEVGTPTYVYSSGAITENVQALMDAFAGVEMLLAYSVKANSNLALLSLLSKLGSGFDIVSEGELRRVLAAGGRADRVVFAGVGKTQAEMQYALSAGIRMFNVESAEELAALDAVGRATGVRAPFALRVNPDVDAKTHRHIATGLKTSKFGIPFQEAMTLYRKSKTLRGVRAVGVDVHIGSQLTQLAPVKRAMEKVAEFYAGVKRQGVALETLDVGGGLGIAYTDEKPPTPAAYASAVMKAVAHLNARLVIEPGRSVVGNAGVLLCQILYRKKTAHKTFIIVDTGMNDLLRPALYEAHHEIAPVSVRSGKPELVEVVGPVCESTDVLARERRLVLPKAGDVWAIRSAGAYGMSMASTYNSRPRPAEVLVTGAEFRLIRPRESHEALFQTEG